MSRVLERRRQLLSLMRQVTLEHGSFTIAEVAAGLALPRSTVQASSTAAFTPCATRSPRFGYRAAKISAHCPK